MAIPPQYITPTLLSPNPRVQFINTDADQGGRDGGLPGSLSTTGMQLLQQFFTALNGMAPTVPCNAAFDSNKYTFTPVNIAPRVKNYFDFWSFAFVAPATSTGLVTATVVPATGSLPTIPVYKTNGSAQATVGDITVNLFYVVYFVDSLNSGNGGFVLK